jgi:hypothetical protein
MKNHMKNGTLGTNAKQQKKNEDKTRLFYQIASIENAQLI